MHCLRHSNATLLLNSGVNIKIVSKHLGHSNISTNGNIHADVLASSRQKTAAIVELKLAKKSDSQPKAIIQVNTKKNKNP